MDHIGIDVHKGASQICILTETGEYEELPHPHRARRRSRRFSASGPKPALCSRPRPRANGWRDALRRRATK